jgi:hypothetical protein
MQLLLMDDRAMGKVNSYTHRQVYDDGDECGEESLDATKAREMVGIASSLVTRNSKRPDRWTAETSLICVE